MRVSALVVVAVEAARALTNGQLIAADHVITFADVTARPVPGLPTDRLGA